MKTTKKILSLLGLTYTLAWHSPGLTAPRGLTLLYAYLRWCFAEISFEKLYPQELEKPRPNALATNHFRFDENAIIIIFEYIHFWMDCRLKGTTPWQPSCQICVWSIVNLFSWIIVVIAKMWLLMDYPLSSTSFGHYYHHHHHQHRHRHHHHLTHHHYTLLWPHQVLGAAAYLSYCLPIHTSIIWAPARYMQSKNVHNILLFFEIRWHSDSNLSDSFCVLMILLYIVNAT